MLRNLANACGLWVLCSCTPNPEAAAQKNPPSPSASAQPSRSATATATAVPAPWYVGQWTGEYLAKKHDPLQGKNEGQQLAWVKDPGKSFVGAGSMQLLIDNEGLVTGDLQGALGGLQVSGVAQPSGMQITIQPEQNGAEAFSGTAMGSFENRQLVLELRVASQSGHFVRSANATLKRTGAE